VIDAMIQRDHKITPIDEKSNKGITHAMMVGVRKECEVVHQDDQVVDGSQFYSWA